MHILAIPSWYPNPENPFNGNFVARHLELLAQKHQVTVLHFISAHTQDISVRESKTGNLRTLEVSYPKKKSKIARYFSLRKAFSQAVKEVQSVDLVHGHVLLDMGIVALWAKQYFKKPLVITEHASYLLRENYQRLSLKQKMIIVRTLRYTAALSCVSPLLEEEIRYLFPYLKIFVTPNIIREDLFSIPGNKKTGKLTFVHISTLEPVKNVTEIIRGFELFSENQDFTLKIVAEKRDPELEKQISSSPIRDKINLDGPLPLEQVAAELRQADALVMLSSYETFSCVIAEAWSSGVPVISTPVGIARELPPEAGVSVNAPTAKDLHTALERFLERRSSFDPEKIRDRSAAYSEKAVLDSFDRFYAAVI